MILSHLHRFIFIKGRKVAGTSAEIALSQLCGPNDIITPITPKDERHRLGTAGEPRNYVTRYLPRSLRKAVEREYSDSVARGLTGPPGRLRVMLRQFWNHMPLREALRLVPEARDYRVVCVERSPYAKVMSLANWESNRAQYAKGYDLDRSTSAIVDAVDRLISTGAIRGVLNIDHYRDCSGTIRASVWNIDRLAHEIAEFARSLGCEPPELVWTKKGVSSDAVEPRTVLRSDQIAAINQIFAEEFSALGWPMLN